MEYMIYNSENVVLTHIIKCHLEIKDQGKRAPNCKICKNEAVYLCENDNEYFCKKCDETVHGGQNNTFSTKVVGMMREQHTRVLVENAKKFRFGLCKSHP